MGDCWIRDQRRQFGSIQLCADPSDIHKLTGDLASQGGKPFLHRRFAAGNYLDDRRSARFGLAVERVREGAINPGSPIGGSRLCGRERWHQHHGRDDRDRPFT
jgi:hypothetical protein